MQNKPHYLPGDRRNRDDISALLRVDHAGEYGAVRIYEGQIAGDKDGKNASQLQNMLEQEKQHLQKFQQLLNQHGVRPSLLSPLWYCGGYALGYATARLNSEAAMACTEAVESVIDEHYGEQIKALDKRQHAGLAAVLETFRQEEIEHRDWAIACGARRAAGHSLLVAAISQLTRLSIALAKRL